MNQQELEEWFIRSLDVPVTKEETEKFLNELHRFPELTERLMDHKKVRELMAAKQSATFGPYFAQKLMYRIQNTGIVIDHQLFSFFKKFQLAALGVIVLLLVLNVMLTDQMSLASIFGIDRIVTPLPEEVDVPFDFFDTLNKNL